MTQLLTIAFDDLSHKCIYIVYLYSYNICYNSIYGHIPDLYHIFPISLPYLSHIFHVFSHMFTVTLFDRLIYVGHLFLDKKRFAEGGFAGAQAWSLEEARGGRRGETEGFRIEMGIQP